MHAVFQREESAVELAGDASEMWLQCGVTAAATSIRHDRRRLPSNHRTWGSRRGRAKPRKKPTTRPACYQVERRRNWSTLAYDYFQQVTIEDAQRVHYIRRLTATGPQQWKREPDRQWRSSSFQESKKVRVSRDLWTWPWPWAHPGCRLTWSPSCESLVAIRPFVCEKKRFAQKFTDGETDRQTTDASPLLILGMS